MDQVEVVLAFRVRLFKDLDLPGKPSQIRFEHAAGNIDEGVKDARRRILASQSEDTLALWMVGQRFWTKYLERAYGSKFKLPRHFRDKERALGNDEDSLRALEALQKDVDQWRLDQRLALTKAAMRRLTWHWQIPTPGQPV